MTGAVFTQEQFDQARVAKPGLIGDWGMPPHEPCRECGGVEFRTMDWGMGYFCVACMTRFGTIEEHAKYRRGEPR